MSFKNCSAAAYLLFPWPFFSLRSDDATSDLTDVCYAFYWEMQMYYPLQLLHISLINQCIVTTNGLALHEKICLLLMYCKSFSAVLMGFDIRIERGWVALIHCNCGEDSCDVDVGLRCIRSCIGSIRGIGVMRVVRVSWMILLVEERAVVTPEITVKSFK